MDGNCGGLDHIEQREAEGRLNDLIKTVEYLTSSASMRAPEIAQDLEGIRQAQAKLQA
jgi:hypothetical protein